MNRAMKPAKSNRLLAVHCVFTCMMAGCAVPYAYPKIDKTQRIDLGESAKGVTALRVDFTAAGSARWERRASHYEIALLPIDPEHSEIPEQSRVGLERGLYHYMFDLTHNNNVGEGMEVRLYRRGSRALRLNNSYQGGSLPWTAATTPLEREQAIDTMFGPDVAGIASTQPSDDPPVAMSAEELFQFTASGSTAFKQACDFGAAEYAAMKVDPALSAADRERIAAKEAYLRNLFDGK